MANVATHGDEKNSSNSQEELQKFVQEQKSEDRNCLIVKETVSSGFDRMAGFVSAQ